MDQEFINFIIEVLADDHGISEDGWHTLMRLHGRNDRLDDIINQVDAIDGRYFLPEDHPVIEQYSTYR